jgi:histone deacetylase 11
MANCKCVCIIMTLCGLTSNSAAGDEKTANATLPIIYSSGYNISVLGLEKLNPFDSKKYGKVYKTLIADGYITPQQICKPTKVSDQDLLLIHTPEYLKSLKRSGTIATIAEVPALRFVPAFILRKGMIDPMRLATGGTILGVRLAMQYGWAINLSGGYHHAKANNGEGFCVFADVPIALSLIWKEKPGLKVLIVDLDAHQGNGNSTIVGNDSRVAILDMYNCDIYPKDTAAEHFVKYKIPLKRRTGTSEYLDSLKKWLPVAIKNENPGFIIYNAGTDVFNEDPLGALSVTEQGILERDSVVLNMAIERKIPVLMVLSGGYHKKSAAIIAKSIEKFLDNIRHNPKPF